MKNFLLLLLLLLTLITGSEAGSQDYEVETCEGGWVDFTCRYPDTKQKYQAVGVKFEDHLIKNSGKDWKHIEECSFFHNTTSKNLRVIIRRLKSTDFGDYKCIFFRNSGRRVVEVEVKKAENLCPSPPTQTVFTGSQTTVTCEFPEKPNQSWVKFLCKDNNVTCEDILTTESSLTSNRTFSFMITNSGFQLSIKSVSKWHKGVYWCGLKHAGRKYRVGFKQLIVKDESLPSKTTSTASKTTSTSPRTTCSSTPSKTTTTASGTTSTSSTDSELKPVIPVLITIVVLLIIVIIVYTSFRCFKNRKEGQVKTDKEKERTYEEIQERPPQSNSGTVLNSIYTTAQHPTVPSASALHSSSTGTSSGEVNDHTYSTALDATQSPPDSTVNPLPTSSEDPFYSTLSNHSSPEEGPH